MEKIIQIKHAENIQRDGKEWVELTDHEGKLHRIFPRMKRADDSWLDMSEKVGLLITQVFDEGIIDKWMKLTKEKVGQYYNISDFEFVAEALPPPSPTSKNDEMTKEDWEQKDNIKRASIEAQTAYNGIMLVWSTGQLKENSILKRWAGAWSMNKLGATIGDIKLLLEKELTKKEGGA